LPVWIDADPAYGEFSADTDDVFALMQAFGSPELSVRGVSVVHGNMRRFDRSVGWTRELVRDWCAGDWRGGSESVPVLAGAREAGDLGQHTPASRALARELARERLSILALGPLTTVATVLGHRPDLHCRIERIVAVAGRSPGLRLSPGGGLVPRGPLVTFSDMNFESDPEAFRVVLDSRVEVTLVPYEACSQVFLGSGDLKRLHEAGALPGWLSDKAQSWLSLWTHLIGLNAFFPFDTLAVGVLTSPSLVSAEPKCYAKIERESSRRIGRRRHRERATLVVSGEGGGRPVGWCLGPKPGFGDDLIARLIAGGIEMDRRSSPRRGISGEDAVVTSLRPAPSGAAR
jgi:pyrimidine-specific ribonucleoside hydrolase